MLQLDLDKFTWQRPTSHKKGFTWQGAGDERNLVLAPGASFKDYRPDPSLFRDFAGLDPKPTPVLTFANRYGLLRHELQFNTLCFWRTGIVQMKRLVKLGDAVSASDWKGITSALEPFCEDARLAKFDDIRPILEKRNRQENVPKNEIAHAALMRLYLTIAPIQRFEVEGLWDDRNRQVQLRLKHDSLLGFMFWQLAHAVLGNRRFNRCTICGKWFLLDPIFTRKDRTTCTDYCRLKQHRLRKKARELHAQGWTARRVAKEMGLDFSLTKKWLSQRKA
jgi:hypothetical protein